MENYIEHMKKAAILGCITLSLFCCKDKNTTSETETVKAVSEDLTLPKTYAEISMAEGGQWVDGPRGHKEYAGGTHFKNVDSLIIPKEHTDHTWYIRYEGPGWENKQVGYRIYLDWRNAIDIFGKKVDSMVLPYVGQDGFDSYHEPADWGQDILKAGKSMGIGGYGRLVADSVVHFQSVKNAMARIENTKDSSSVHISYDGWKAGDDIIDLKSTLTIYPDDRYTKVRLSPSKEITGICTGIVDHGVTFHKNEGETWSYIATYGEQTLASPPDKLGMALFYNRDEVDIQKDGEYEHLVIFKPTSGVITYYFLGAWEQEPNGIKTEEDFISDLNLKLRLLNEANSLK